MAGALSYAHVTISLNLNEIDNQITTYENYLGMILKHTQTSTMRKDWVTTYDYYNPSLKLLLENTDKRFQDVIQIHFGNAAELRKRLNMLKHALPRESLTDRALRSKRAIVGPIIGTFMGLYNRHQLRKLRREIAATQNTQHLHFEMIQNLSVSLIQVQKEMTSLQSALNLITLSNPAYVVSALARTEERISRAIEEATHLIQQAQHRRLAIDFLTPQQVDGIYERVFKLAKQSGCRLIPEQPSDLYQLEVSYFSEENRLSIILHVPMSPRESVLRLFRFRPFPLPLNKKLTVLPTVKTDVLGISHGDRFSLELNYADLMDCHTINRFYLCERHGILRKTLSVSCLGALWNQQFEEAHRLCDMSIQPYQESVLQLQDNWHLIYSPVAFTAPVQCQNGSESDVHFRVGINKHHLDASCKVSLKDHVVIADSAHHMDGAVKHFDWVWDQNILNQLSSSEMTTSMQQYVESGAERFSLDDLIKSKAVRKSSPGWSIFWILMALSIAALLGLALTCSLGYAKFVSVKIFIKKQFAAVRTIVDRFIHRFEAVAVEEPQPANPPANPPNNPYPNAPAY